MKKRIVSIVCMAAFAAVVTFGCIGTETAEAAQQGAADEQQEQAADSPEIYGPLKLETSGGMTCVAYEVYNGTSENMYFAFTVNCMDESYNNIETLSAFTPCIGPDEWSLIYVVDYSGVGEDGQYVCLTFWGESDFVSAAGDLTVDYSYSEEGNYYSFSAFNLVSDIIWLPEITVCYYLDDVPCYVSSGPIAEAGTNYLYNGSGGYVNLDAPEEFDYCEIYVSALYN